jgi:hypothetical protein
MSGTIQKHGICMCKGAVSQLTSTGTGVGWTGGMIDEGTTCDENGVCLKDFMQTICSLLASPVG